jgi:hypothetical protein
MAVFSKGKRQKLIRKKNTVRRLYLDCQQGKCPPNNAHGLGFKHPHISLPKVQLQAGPLAGENWLKSAQKLKHFIIHMSVCKILSIIIAFFL